MKMRQMFQSSTMFAVLILACALIGLTTGQAFAAAAGPSIKNTASVTYDESPTPATSNEVTTTVNLVSGLAWLDSTLSPTTQAVGPNFTLTTDYTVAIHNTGNGTTTATITGSTSETDAGLSAGTWTINGVASPSIELFATVSSGQGVVVGATTEIPVGWIDPAQLTAGSTVVRIGGSNFTVAANSTATLLVVTGNATAVATGAGIQIGEVETITFTGTTGALSSITGADYNHSMTASDDVGGGLNADGNSSASDTISSDADGGGGNLWHTTVSGGVLTVAKYVRNDTAAFVGGTSISYDGETYYQTGVSGDEGDTLEYLVVITNSGPGSASNVVMSDVLSPYVLLTQASVNVDTDGDGDFDYAGGVAGNLATLTGSTLTVYAGTGGNEATSGGTIAAPVLPATEVVSAIRYQVVIQ